MSNLKTKFNILFLPSWYPSSTSDLSGVFFKELAMHLSSQHQVWVLFMQFSVCNTVQRNNITNNCSEVVIHIKKRSGIFGKIFNEIQMLFAFVNEVKLLRKKGVEIDLSHVNVAWKMGWYAWFAKWYFRIPYIVSEHSTGYLSADGRLKGMHLFGSRFILKRSQALTCVSSTFSTALLQKLKLHFTVVPNIIHINVGEIERNSVFTFIHVSNGYLPQKQTDKILEVFNNALFGECKLQIIAPENETIKKLKEKYSHLNNIEFLSQFANKKEYFSILGRAHCLISFSLYETFAISVAEALILNVPCICTRSGGPESYITEQNSIAIENNKEELKTAMEKMMKNSLAFRINSTEYKEKFSPQTVVAAYSSIYKKVFK